MGKRMTKRKLLIISSIVVVTYLLLTWCQQLVEVSFKQATRIQAVAHEFNLNWSLTSCISESVKIIGIQSYTQKRNDNWKQQEKGNPQQGSSASHDAQEVDDGVMGNISIGALAHLAENKEPDPTAFLNWSAAYLGPNRSQTFDMPTYFERSAYICANTPGLLILILTPGASSFSRELVRQTWASSIYGLTNGPERNIALKSKLVFLIGTEALPDYTRNAIKKETLLHKDIVAAEFIDSYRNLTLKMLVGFNWISRYCKNVKFVLKCDLDTFVNLPLMTRLLLEISELVQSFVVGHKHQVKQPPVLRSGKWRVNETDYPFSVFPPYLMGHSYAMSGDLVVKMASVARFLPIIPVEDAYITGILARILKAPRLHFPNFAHVDKHVPSCDIIHNKEVSVTKMSLSRILVTWRYVLLNVCPEMEPPGQKDDVVELQAEDWCELCKKTEAVLFKITKGNVVNAVSGLKNTQN